MTNYQELSLLNRVKGAIFGHALGDALGVGTEFMTTSEIKAYYPDGLRDFSRIIRDAHRSQWLPGETTNDTALFTVQLESIIENNGFDLLHSAEKIKETLLKLNQDLDSIFRLCITTPDWEKSPIAKAEEFRHKYNITEATNDTIYRGLTVGMTSHKEDLVSLSIINAKMTNNDTRSAAAATAIAMMAHSLLHTGNPATYEEIAAEVYNIDGRTISFLDKAYSGNLEDFDLDDEETQMWARKAMGAALWTAWHMDDPEEILYRVINEGGDSDTNAAAACTLAGLRFGYDALPPLKEKLLKKDYFNDLSERLAGFIETL